MPLPEQELQELITYPTENQNGPAKTSSEHFNHLLNAVIHNDLEELKNALSQATEDDFGRKHIIDNSFVEKNILSIACTPTVKVELFDTLFLYAMSHFEHISFVEENWYYWEPIHFAAYHASFDKLGAIVHTLRGTNKLNVLSILSENALHVLLEYGRNVESFNVQLSNGWESRICHVIAEERSDVVKCAALLIEAGIDINHNNIWNETPLIIALRYRLLRVIELLLRKRDVDLDTCKDPFSGKTARDLLRENEICLDLLTPNTVNESPTKALFTFLKNRDEEMFLRYNNENIRQYVNETDGDHESNTSGTMLQLCLIKGYIDFEKEAASQESQQQTDIMKTAMIKFFCKNGFGRSVEHLLNNGAEITKRTRIFGGRDVFQMAVKLNYYPFVTVLLEHRSNQISQYHIFQVLRNISTKCFLTPNCNIRHMLFLLISKLEVIYRTVRRNSEFVGIDFESREVLNGLLDLYLRYYGSVDEYKENICQVLRLGASLTGTLRDSSVLQPTERLKAISYDALRSHLDECISSDNDICYNSLIRDEVNNYSETEALHYLSHDPKKSDLLNHPALVYFIRAKWLKSSKFFYMNLALYTVFLAVLYWYMISLHTNGVNYSLFVIFCILLSLLALKEFVQLLLYGLRYFLTITNYLEVTTIACCLVNVFSKNEMTMVVAILLSTLLFLSMLGQIPKFTKYMIIFSSTKYFLEYASFYFIQFVSFALCFFILLPSDNTATQSGQFDQILIKLFDTLIFFIGQYDGDITSPPKFPIFGRIIVAIFIFCMTIILNNLLVGLIVTDMDVIQKTGKQQRQVKIIRYIARIETFLKRTERSLCLRVLKHFFGNTNVFRSGEHKEESIKDALGMFDDEDKGYLKEIHENRLQHKNVLNNLYEYIISEVYSDNRNVRDNRDILFKLSMLEEQLLSRGKAR